MWVGEEKLLKPSLQQEGWALILNPHIPLGQGISEHRNSFIWEEISAGPVTDDQHVLDNKTKL